MTTPVSSVSSPLASAVAAPQPGSESFEARVHALIETVIRPRLRRDNGDIRVDRIEDNRIYVTLDGACVGCQLSSITLSGIQQRLMEGIGRPVRVIPSHVIDASSAPRRPARVAVAAIEGTPS